MAANIGVLDFLVFVAYYIIAAFLIRMLSVSYSDRPIGKAAAILHG